MRSADLQRSAVRMRVAGAALILVFALLAVRAAHLSVIDGRGAARGDNQTDTVLRIAPARGTVVDRSGSALTITMSAPSVYAEPGQIPEPGQAARALAKVLGVERVPLERRLSQKSRFVFVKRWVSSDQARKVEALELAGIGIVAEPRRSHPLGGLAGQLLGFANIDGQGVRGVEQMENDWLRGHSQRMDVERDARGRLLISSQVDPRSAAGGDVALTVDASLQAEIDADLDEAIAATGARGGIAISMDPRTGDLLAVSDRPGFDPNDFRRVPYRATRSRAFLDAMEPGSSLKPFVVAAALERGVLSPDELIDCENGSFRVPGKTLRDIKPHQLLDPAGVLRVSSNIGAAKIAYKLGAEPHYAALKRFGFGQSTGSGFPDESAGLMRPWKKWRPVDHANVAFGQGLSVTAIQLAAAVSALANGGVWHTPRIVRARRAPGGQWRNEPVSAGRRAVRPDVARRVLTMMEQVVREDGTGRRAALRGVSVAGKTGTAQKFDAATGTYSNDRYLAWFVGVAPSEDPRLVIVVMLDEPRGQAHGGGAVAAPLFSRVAAVQLAQHGIVTEALMGMPDQARIAWVKPVARPKARPLPPTPAPTRTAEAGASPSPQAQPSTQADRDHPAPAPVRSAAPPAKRSRPQVAPQVARLDERVLLPDFRGLSPAEAKLLAASLPFPVEMSGSGHAVAQHPEPGSILSAGGGRVRVRFERAEGDS